MSAQRVMGPGASAFLSFKQLCFIPDHTIYTKYLRGGNLIIYIMQLSIRVWDLALRTHSKCS